MSWDIYVMDIPETVRSVQDLPSGYDPKPIGERDVIIEKIREVCPEADFSDPSWGHIAGRGCAIEVSIGDDTPVNCVAFHVYGGGDAVGIISEILQALGMRAFDMGSETGIFDEAAAQESFRRWQHYRDQIRGLARGDRP